MKSALFFIIVITFSISINAQIYTPSGVIQGTSINNNVGIGTSNTVAKLTIQAGPDGYPTPLKAISIWGPNSPDNLNSAQDISWDFAAAGSAVIRSYRGFGFDTYLQFLTNNANERGLGNAPEIRMHINGNGNVGIGTTSPSAKLSVLGSVSKLTLNGIDGTFDNLIKYGHKLDLESGTTYVNRWHGIDATITAGNGSDNKLKFRVYGGGIANLEPGDVMTLVGNGNVGIGTTNPDVKLAVNGTIHSKEVKVDMLGWSDFVFKKEYNLPTLEEVEKHITEKGYLENIPSEQEVMKNGINLGEMNAKLLQKIEELTLYMIEMKKENVEMKKRIDQIEKK